MSRAQVARSAVAAMEERIPAQVARSAVAPGEMTRAQVARSAVAPMEERIPAQVGQRPVAAREERIPAQVGQRPVAAREERIPAQVGQRPIAAQSAALQLAQGEQWYVVQTQPRKEPTALVNLQKQGFRTFMPRLLKTVRHARKTRTVRAPLFPGYLFTPLDLSRQQWRRINGTIGVASLIMGGDQPKPVPGGVVESLQDLVDDADLVDLGPRLSPGGPVRVITGPFADQLGRLASLDDHGRATVLLEVMGAERTLTIESRSLLAAA